MTIAIILHNIAVEQEGNAWSQFYAEEIRNAGELDGVGLDEEGGVVEPVEEDGLQQRQQLLDAYTLSVSQRRQQWTEEEKIEFDQREKRSVQV